MSTSLLSKMYELLTPTLGKEAVECLISYIESKNKDTENELTRKFATRDDLSKVESRLMNLLLFCWIVTTAAIVAMIMITNLK